MTDLLQEAIQRVLGGGRDEADLLAMANAVQTKQLTLVSGNRAIGVSGNVENSTLIPGNSNIVGSNNVVIQGEAAVVLQTLMAQYLSGLQTGFGMNLGTVGSSDKYGTSRASLTDLTEHPR